MESNLTMRREIQGGTKDSYCIFSKTPAPPKGSDRKRQKSFLKHFVSLLFIAVLSLSGMNAVAQNTYYVNGATGNDVNSGQAVGSAFKTLDAALVVAATSDTVKVAQGTYYPSTLPGGSGRDATFYVTKGIALLGGYNSSFTNRNFVNNQTILSGDIGTVGTETDNVYHVVVWYTPAAEQGIFDGFIVENGYANGTGSVVSTIQRGEGGAFFLHAGTLEMTNNIFRNNKGTHSAGIYSRGILTAVRYNLFTQNQTLAGNSAALTLATGSTLVEANTFTNNTANGGYATIYISSGNATPITIRYNTMVGNVALSGGAVAVYITGNVNLYNNTIVGNAGTNGGAVFNANSICNFGGNIIAGNYSTTNYDVTFSGGTMTSLGYNFLYQSSRTVGTDVIYTGTDLSALFSGAMSGNVFIPNLTSVSGRVTSVAIPRNATTAYRYFQNVPTTELSTYGIRNAANTAYIDQQNNVIDDTKPAYFSGSVSSNPYTVVPDHLTFYVDSSMAVTGDGTTPAKAFKTLDEALQNVAMKGGDTVKVAKGTYKPGISLPGGSLARDLSFLVTKGISLLGGYNSGFTTHNFITNPTILDGDLGVQGDASDNAYHVIFWYANNVTDQGLFDGFIVQNGNANGTGTTYGDRAYGGGLVYWVGKLQISNNKFYNNKGTNAGGVWVSTNTSKELTLLQANWFDKNTVTGAGGGIYVAVAPVPFIAELNTFTNNTAGSYAGVYYNSGNTSTFRYNTFVGNTTTSSGASAYGSTSVSKDNFYNNTVIGNTSAGSDGAVVYTTGTHNYGNNIMGGNKLTSTGQDIFVGGTYSSQGYNLIGVANTTAAYAVSDMTSDAANLATLFQGSTSDGILFVPVMTTLTTRFGQVVTPKSNNTSTTYLRRIPVSSMSADNTPQNESGIYIDQTFNPIDVSSGFYLSGSVSPATGTACPSGTNNIWYVDANTAGTGEGYTAGTPAKDLSALLRSSCLQSGDTIKVATGTYYPGYTMIGGWARDKTFMVDKAVSILGGYNNTFTTRDIVNNPTTLSGDIGVANDSTDNAHHIVIWDVPTSDTKQGLLDGFIIRDGLANGIGTITTYDRTQASALYFKFGKLQISNNNFYNNVSNVGRAAVWVINTSTPTLIQANRFEKNRAAGTTGIAALALETTIAITVELNTFINNYSNSNAGALCNNSTANHIIRYNTFVGNATVGYGAAYFSQTNASERFYNNTVIGNTGTTGGAVWHTTGTHIYGNNIIAGNKSTTSGAHDFTNGGTITNQGYNLLGTVSGSYGAADGAADGYNLATIFSGTTIDNFLFIPTLTPVSGKFISVVNPISGSVATTYLNRVPASGMTANNTPNIGGNYVDQKFNTIDVTSGFYYTGSVSLSAPACPATIVWYVDSAATVNGDGSSIATPTKDLSNLLRSSCLKLGDTVKVAKGTYYPAYVVPGGSTRDKTFMVDKGISLLGGYTSTFTTRDFVNNSTVLSGDIGIVDDSTDNAHHIMIWDVPVADTKQGLLDGFVIQKGLANIASTVATFERNYAAALYFKTGKLQISNNKFCNNTGTAGNGTVYVAATSSPTLIHANLFDKNTITTGNGGALTISSSTATVVELNTFTNNYTGTNGAFYYTTTAISDIRYNTFISNTAGGVGAGFYSNGGVERFYNNTIIGNTNGSNGAVYFGSGTHIFGQNIIFGNKSTTGTHDFYWSGTISNQGYNTVFNGSGAFAATDIYVIDGVASYKNMFDYTYTDATLFVPVLTTVPNTFVSVVVPKQSTQSKAYLQRVPVANMTATNTPKNAAGDYIDQQYNIFNITSGLYYAGSVSRIENCTANTVWYVDSAAVANGDGSSITTPTNDLSALLLSSCLKAGDTIKVAKGTYIPSLPPSYSGSDQRYRRFLVNKSVVLLGGYTSTFTEGTRDYISNKTIFEADYLHDGSHLTNIYNLVFWDVQNDSKTGVFEGFVLQGANAGGGHGSGFYHNFGNLEIKNNEFRNNYAGNGALYVSVNANLTILHGNWFHDNTVTYGGGAAFAGAPKTLIEFNTFTNNKASSYGGGLYLGATSTNFFVIKNNTFAYNNVVTGGGIFASTNAKYYNNTIIGNHASSNGGGIYATGSKYMGANVVAGNRTASVASNMYVSEVTVNEGYSLVGVTSVFNNSTTSSPDLLVELKDLLNIYEGSIPFVNNIFEPVLQFIPGKLAPVLKLANSETSITALRRVPVASLSNNGSLVNGVYVDQTGTPIDQTNLDGFYHSGSVNVNTPCANNPTRTWYVNKNTSTPGQGVTPALPLKDLSSLLTSLCLKQGDTIKVAAATYIPELNRIGSADSRARSFYVDRGVILLGGYDSTFAEAERNVPVNRTILHGDWDGDGNLANNTYNVMIWNVTNSINGILDGFEIRNGFGTNGAGLYHTFGNLKINNNRFVRNTSSGAGGAIYISGGNLTHFTTNHIDSNSTATNNGGGIYFVNDPSTVFEYNTFTKNTAANGGAIYFNSAGVNVFDLRFNTFAENIITGSGSAIYMNGYTNFFNNTVVGNTTNSNSWQSSAIYCSGPITFGGNLFAGNKSGANLTWGSATDIGANGASTVNKGYNAYYSIGSYVSTNATGVTDIRIYGNEAPLLLEGSAGNNLFTPIYTNISGQFAPVIMPRNNVAARTVLQRVPLSELSLNGIKRGANYYDQKQVAIDETNTVGAFYSGSVNGHTLSTQSCLPNLARVWYVNASAPDGGGNATSPATAATELGTVLNSQCIQHGDTVKVMEGTYYPTFLTQGLNDDRDRSFMVQKGIHVMGGYKSDFSETTRTTCGNKTILNGNWDKDANQVNNTYHIMIWDVDSTKIGTIDGFVFREASATGAGSIYTNIDRSYGGGLYVRGGALSVSHSAFKKNIATNRGGAIYAISGTANGDTKIYINQTNVDSNSISVSSTNGYGGGIYFNTIKEAQIDHSTFYANSSAEGGAVYATGTPMSVSYSTFVNNTTSGGLAAALNYVGSYTTVLNFFQNTVMGNKSAYTGTSTTAAVYVTGTSTPFVYGGNVFAGNENSAAPTVAGDLYSNAMVSNRGYNIFSTLSNGTKVSTDSIYTLSTLSKMFKGTSLVSKRLIPTLQTCACTQVVYPIDTIIGMINIVPVATNRSWMNLVYGGTAPIDLYDQCQQKLDTTKVYYLSGSIDLPCVQPIATPVVNIIVCNRDTINQINFTADRPGTVYNWMSTVNIGMAASAQIWQIRATFIPKFASVNTTQTTIIDTVKVVPIYNNCIGDTITFTITIYPTPVITLPTDRGICLNLETTLTAVLSPGATVVRWTTSNPAVASFVSLPGTSLVATLKGNTVGFSNVYCVVQNGNGCFDSSLVAISVNNPVTMLGITPANQAICGKSSIQLTNATVVPVGVKKYWYSGDTNTATVDSTTGLVTAKPIIGIPKAIKIYYYVESGCNSLDSTNLTINPVPSIAAISSPTGSDSVCVNKTLQLNNTTPSGTWMSVDTNIAKVDAVGLVKGKVYDTTTIRYIVTNGCLDTVSFMVRVQGIPTIAQPQAPAVVCSGNKISPIAPDIVTYGAPVIRTGWLLDSVNFNPVTENVNFDAHNNKYLQYYAITICDSVISQGRQITVYDKPFIDTIKTVMVVCSGSTFNAAGLQPTYNDRGQAATTNGWQINSANITLPYTLTYADNGKTFRYYRTNNCGTTYSATKTLIVNDKTTLGSLAGVASICEYDTIQPVTPTKTSKGAIVISEGWLLDGSLFNTKTPLSMSDNGKQLRYYINTSCGGDTTNAVTITIKTRPAISPITGPTSVCIGGTVRLRSTPTGGTWKSADNYLSVDNTGLATGLNAGEGEIRYILTNSVGCTDSVNTYVTVNPSPAVTSFSGGDTICTGSAANFSIALSGTQPFTITVNTGGSNISRQVNGYNLTEVVNNVTSTAICKVIDVTDINGCRRTYSPALADTVNVFGLPDITIKDTSVCVNNSAVMTFTRVKGEGMLTIAYSVNGSAGYTAIIPEGEAIGTTTISNVTGSTLVQVTQVRDGNGCVQLYTGVNMRNATITTKPLPTVTISTLSSVCYDTKDTITFTRNTGGLLGNVMIDYTEGGIPKTATILDGNNSVKVATDKLQSLTEIKVENVSNSLTGCETTYPSGNGPSRNIAVLDLPEVSVTSLGDICVGSNGKVNFTRLSGVGGLQITYYVRTILGNNTPKTFSMTNGQNTVDLTVDGIAGATSAVRITEVKSLSNGCTSTYTDTTTMPSTLIHAKPLPNVTVVPANNPVCYGSTGAFRVTNTTGAVSDLMWIYYTINNGIENVATIAKNNSSVNIDIPGIAADQTIKITKISVNGGCDSIYTLVNQPTSTINVQVSPSLTTLPVTRTGSGSVDLTAGVSGGEQTGYTYTYYSDAAATQLIATPTTVNVTGSRSYWVKMKANVAPSCESIGEITVVVTSTAGFSIDQDVQAVCLGDTAIFTVTLSNGGVAANNLEVQIANGSNLAFVSSAGGSYSAGVWTIPSLNSGAFASLTLRYKTMSTSPVATVRNTAVLTKANGNTLTIADQVRSEKSVQVNASPTASLYVDNNTICSGSSATMTVNMTGTAPFTIEYHNGISTVSKGGLANMYTETLSNITTDRTYTISSVQDANGCTTTYNAGTAPTETVTVKGLPAVTVIADTVCNGNDAHITFVRKSGIIGDLNIWYNVQGTPAGLATIPSAKDSITVTVYGVITRSAVQVTKVSNSDCENAYTGNGPLVHIEVKALPVVVMAVSPGVCFGSDGWVRFTRSGTVGNMTVTYTISDIITKTATINNGNTSVDSVVAGITSATDIKIINISDAGTGCIRSYDYGQEPKSTISVRTLPSVNMNAPTAVCEGGTATLSFTRVDGSGKLTVFYSVNNVQASPLDITSIMATAQIVNVTATTTVHIDSVKDANSCTNIYPVSDYSTININPLPDVTVNAVQNVVCKGGVGVFRIQNAGGGIANGDMTVYYTINGNSASKKITDGSAYVDIDVINIVVPQTINITNVTSASGCGRVYTTYPTANLDTVSLPTLTTMNLSFTGTGSRNLTDAVTNLNPAYDYSYYTSTGQIVVDPIAENVMNTGNYRVVAKGKTSPYCETEKWFTVTVLSTSGFTLNQSVSSVCNGDTAVFTVRLINSTPSDAVALEVTDNFGAGLTLISAIPSGTGTYIAGTWTIPTLNTGATGTLVLKFKTNSTLASDLNNTAVLVQANGNPLSAVDQVRFESVVTVNTLPKTTLALMGSDTICSGSEANFAMNFTSGTQPFTIVCNVTGKGNLSHSVAGLSYTEMVSNVNSAVVCSLLKITDNNGCIVEYPQGVIADTVNVYTQPEVTVFDTNVCAGGTATLTFNKVRGTGIVRVFYNVAGVSGYSTEIPAGQTSTTAMLPNINSNTFIQITGVQDANCTRNYSGSTATISVKALPTVNMAVTNPVCANSQATVSFSRGTGSSIGTITVNYTEDGLAKTAIIDALLAKVDSLTSAVITPIDIVVTSVSNSVSGCSMVYNDNGPIKTISVTELAEVSIASMGDVCNNTTGNFAITRLVGVGGIEVTYQLNGGSNQTMTLSNGQNSKMISINNITSSTEVKVIKVKSISKNCENIYSAGNEPTATINPLTLPTVSVASFTDTVCAGSSSGFILNGSNTEAYTVNYRINGGILNSAYIDTYGSTAFVNVSNIMANQKLVVEDVVSTTTGCRTTYTTTTYPKDSIIVLPLPVLNVQNISRTGSGLVDLSTAVISANTTDYDYTYYSNATLTAVVASPVNGDATHSYWVKMKAKASPYCEIVKEFTVTITSTTGFSLDQDVQAVCLGDTASFNITLSNNGNNAANIQVSNIAGSNLMYIGTSDAVNYNPATKIWEISSLASGTSTTLTLKYKTNAIDPEATLRNTVTLMIANGDTLKAGDQVKSIKSVIVNGIPSGALSLNSDNICSGNAITMTLNLSGTAPFTVQYNNGATSVTKNNVPNLYSETFTNIASNRIYTLNSVKDANGCVVTYTTNKPTDSVEVNVRPVVSIIPDTVCIGGDAKITFVRQSGGGAINVVYNVQGSIVGSALIPANKDSVTAIVNSVSSRSVVQVTKVTDSICETAYVGNGPLAYIEIKTLPAVALTVPSTICYNSDATIKFSRVETTGITTVTYTINDVITKTAIIPNGANSVDSIVFGITETTEISISKVQNSVSGCENVYTNNGPSKTISIINLPEVSIESNGNVCDGSNGSVRITRLAGVGALKVTYTDGINSASVNLSNGQNTANVILTGVISGVATTVKVTEVENTSTHCTNTSAVGSEPTTVISPIALPNVDVSVFNDSICATNTATFAINYNGTHAPENMTVYYRVNNGTLKSATILQNMQNVEVSIDNALSTQILKVTKIVSGGNGCQTTYNIGSEPADTVVVSAAPIANFTTALTGLAKIEFTNTSVDGVSYSWNFGDGGSSTDYSPEHTYTTSGNYTVTLTTTSTSGCFASISKTINVATSTDLNADFVVNATSQCRNGNEFSFTNKSTITTPEHKINTYAWNFGDGNTSTDKNAMHTYASAGTYTVTLIVTEIPSGTSDTVKQTMKVLDVPVIFDGTALDSICAGGRLQVNMPDSIHWNGNTPVMGTWLLGGYPFDPNTTDLPAFANGKLLQYAVNSTCGMATSPGVAIKINANPVADFSTSVTDLGQIAFADSSKNAASWTWNFGDGNTSIVKNPSHQYTYAGTYTITLSVTSVDGCISSITKTIAVSTTTDLEARFNIVGGATTQCLAGNNFVFQDASRISTPNHSIASYKWYFGNGDSASTKNATYTYTKDSTYTVTLVVTEAPGETQSSVSQIVKVISKPVILDTASIPTVCEGDYLSVKAPIIDWKGNTPVDGKWYLDGVAFDPISRLVTVLDNGKVLQYRVNSICGLSSGIGSIITITTSPIMNAIANATYCAEANVAKKVLGSATGVTYKWRQISGDNIGMSSLSGIDTIPQFQAVNTGTTPLAANFEVTPSNGNCNGNTIQFSITVNPTAKVNSELSVAPLCSGSIFSYKVQSQSEGANFTWRRLINTDINNGNTNNAISSIIEETLVNNGTTATEVLYEIATTTLTCSAGHKDTLRLKVNPTPMVNNVQNFIYCNNEQVSRFNFAGNILGATYKWEQITGGGNNGMSTQGADSLATFTASNHTEQPIVSYYKVQAMYINGSSVCAGSERTFMITVNPAIKIVSATDMGSICSGTKFDYTAKSGSLGATFSWTRAAVAGINNGASGNGSGTTISETLTNTTASAVSVKYIFTLSYGSCSDTSSVVVLVNPTPDVSIDALQIVCGNANEIKIPYKVNASQQGLSMEYSLTFGQDAQRAGFKDVLNAPLSGDTIEVAMPNGISTGFYSASLRVNIVGGCESKSSLPINIQVSEDTRIVTQPESQALCTNDGFGLSVTAVGGNLSFQWYKDQQPITGATHSTYSIDHATEADYGKYYVEVSGRCGVVISAVVNVKPNEVMVETNWDAVLYVSGIDSAGSNMQYASYLWYKASINGDLMPILNEGSGQYYQDPQGLNGTYAIEVTFANGQKKISCPVSFEPLEKTSFKVYPNPVLSSSKVTVSLEMSKNNTSDFLIEVINALGQTVKTTSTGQSITELQLNVLSGTYVVRVTDPKGKIMIQKLIVK